MFNRKNKQKENDVTATQKIRMRSQLSREKMSELERGWLADTRVISFNDWAYVFHNVFLYDIPNDQIKVFGRYLDEYLTVRISDPNYSGYTHFVLWLKTARAFSFTCASSSQGTDHIINVYDEYVNNTPLDEEDVPAEEDFESNSVVMTALSDLLGSRWEDIGDEWAKSSFYKMWTVYDYGLLVHNIVAYSHGGDYVSQYNTSTFSHKDSGNFLTFPMYLKKMVKKAIPNTVTTKFKSWDELDIAYCKMQFKDGDIPVSRDTAKVDDKTKAKVVKAFKPMPAKDLAVLIETIKSDVERGHLAADMMKLAMAEKYHARITSE
jgi:hypothetical protein